MAATITANPNPVSITIWSFSQQGSTTIVWDTDQNNRSGTVWVTDSSGQRVLTDRVTNAPAIGVNGNSRTRITLGEKYLFELKRTDNPAIVLASVTVEGREELGLPGKIVDAIHSRMPLRQGITNLRVLPSSDSVRILFRTRQPTVPVIDIKDANTQALAGAAFSFFGSASQSHDYTFPLAPSTDFAFHIFAYAVSGNPAEQSGLFRTGSINAQVFFDHIWVHYDGDPGSLGDGEFRFNMGAGDINSGAVLGSTWFIDDISGGENRSINQSVVIDGAPLDLWVQVFADEDDSIWSHFLANPSIEFAPEGSVSTYQDDSGESEGVIVTKWFDLRGTDAVPQEIPFTLKTDPIRIDFTLNCRLRKYATPGAVLQPQVTKSAKPIVRTKTVAAMVVGDRVAVAGRRTHVLSLAHGGGLYHAYADHKVTADGAKRKVRWTLLSGDVRGPLTVIAADDGLLHLLAAGPGGEVLHRALSPDSVEATSGHETWSSLGGSFVWPPAVAVTKEGMDLFALNAEGGVFHKRLTTNAGDEWSKIGEGIGGSLNAFSTERGEIGVVAIGRNGEIQHLPFVRNGAGGVAPKWHRLGTAPLGEFSAEVLDDVVVLAVLTEEETVHAAPWRNYPDPPSKLEWRQSGTMNALITARYSLLSFGDTGADDVAVSGAAS